MKLISCKLSNVGRFELASLDLTQLTPEQRIVAFDGDTGAGKSTMVEAMTGGGLFREFVTHGSLGSMVGDREGSLRSSIEHGGVTFDISHLVKGNKGESVLSSGVFAYNQDAKKTSFDAAVAEHFPEPKLLYATVWRKQADDGFLQLTMGERKELVLLAVGATKWEAWAKTFRDREKAKRSEASEKRSMIVQLGTPEIEAATTEISELQFRIKARLTPEVTVAQLDLDASHERAGNTALARQEFERLRGARQKLTDAIDKASLERAGIIVRIDELQALLARGSEIRAAVATVSENEKSLATLREKLAAATAEKKAIDVQYQALKTQLVTLRGKQNDLEKFLQQADAIEGAVRDLPQAQTDSDKAELDVDETQEEINILRSAQVAGKDDRIKYLRDGLSLIAGTVSGSEIANPREHAAETLATDDSMARGAIETPKKLEEARARLGLRKTGLANCITRTRRLELLAAKADEIVRALDESNGVASGIVDASNAIAGIDADLSTIAVTIETTTAEGKRIAQASAILAPIAAQAPALERAEATLAELSPRQGQLGTELAALQSELDSLPQPTPPEQGPDLVQLESALAEAQSAHAAAVAALGAAGERLRQARETAEHIDALRGDLVALESEAAQWSKLAADCGRDGVQADLIDGAGPELTATSNHLLHSCYGSRFTLEVSTQRQSSDGKRTLEECEVRVDDQGDELENAPARVGEGKTFSGGEKEILNLAFQFALTHLARNAGIVRPDFVMDEPGSALNESLRPKWMDMIRRACDVIGIGHVYLITHDSALKYLADSRIMVERGTVRIEP